MSIAYLENKTICRSKQQISFYVMFNRRNVPQAEQLSKLNFDQELRCSASSLIKFETL